MQPKASQIINSLLSTCLLLSLICYITEAQDPPAPFCEPSSSNYSRGSTYQSNLNDTLAFLASNISSNGFYTRIVGESPNIVYGLLQCRYDISYKDCKICANNSKSEITADCPTTKEAMLFSDNCVLRYADKPIFAIPDITVIPLLYLINTQNISNPDSFDIKVEGLLNNLSKKAVSDDSRFSVGETAFDAVTIYGMVQCTRDLSPDDCSRCLKAAVAHLRTCCEGRRGGRVLSKSCDFRYGCLIGYCERTLYLISTIGSNASSLQTVK